MKRLIGSTWRGYVSPRALLQPARTAAALGVLYDYTYILSLLWQVGVDPGKACGCSIPAWRRAADATDVGAERFDPICRGRVAHCSSSDDTERNGMDDIHLDEGELFVLASLQVMMR
ncbi:hypothetical protein [Nocardia sp. NPDC019304]|uniref:hypothetical protein n=1 Tax=unclassified Nocardia TaxID=2637762 RepID=UPI0033F28D4B